MRVYVIYGQGGRLWSGAFHSFGKSLPAEFNVTFWTPSRPNDIVADIVARPRGKIAILGYSWGVNCASWVVGGLPGYVRGLNQAGRSVELMVGYDGTVNSIMTPLGSNVDRAICYIQVGRYWPTSLFFGRSKWTAAKGGPEIEYHKVNQDHLAVQDNEYLHKITRKALAELYGETETV